MDANEYQALCKRTAGKGTKRTRMNYTGLGIAGEAGEVADETKKYLFHKHPYNPEKFLKELGDVLWYAAMCADAHGFKLSEVMQHNIDKLSERYPNGFTAEDSINRKK